MIKAFFRHRSAYITGALLFILLMSIIVGTTGQQSAQAAGTLPCDIYAANGTACVAAHSTTRALFGAYSGRLYQVQRASDNATTDINTLSAGGYANAAAQDSFCANTMCTITIIYDQTTRHNDLTISPGGGAVSTPDVGAVADALPVLAGGQKVYGVYVTPGTGYRNLHATGTAVNGQAEGMYMVTSGKHVNDGCCFDYGNTEQPLANDIGNGYMDAVYFGLRCEHAPCSGSGPWIAADLENGLFQGNGSNTANQTVNFDVVTAMLKNNGQTTFALKTGNGQSGGLTTQYNGTLPNGSYNGYIPMHQQGGIVMGVGGDNSNWSAGSFLEGAMTFGYPTDAAENAVQANITTVGYAMPTYSQLVPTSESTGQSWKYTTSAPASNWASTSFSDAAWATGTGGFGTAGTPGAVVRTTWSTADLWMRRTFNPGTLTSTQISNLVFRLHHDEGAELYINGVQALAVTGYTSSYDYISMNTAGRNAVVSNGNNVLAIHVHQTTGGQYIDAGLAVRSFPGGSVPTNTPAPTTPPPGPTNVARSKPATSSGNCATTEGPDKAVNGSVSGGNTDKWCGNAATKWMQVDLQASYVITQFIVRHAGAGGESTSWNTNAFNIQISNDNVTWTTPVAVSGNTASITTHNITATSARYVRLNVTNGGSDGIARIYEFEVYGTYPRLKSFNIAGNYVRHQNSRFRIDSVISPVEDSLFKIVPGLADASAVSFESVNFPGSFLRHRNGEIWLDANDGSALFKSDATWRRRPGLANASWTSYESYNFPNEYIRHQNSLLYRTPIVTDLDKADATFQETN